jgi:hypothetical protein
MSGNLFNMINIFITAYILSCFKEVALFFLSRTQVNNRVEDTDATAADVETRFGEHIVTGVSLLTDEPGAKRKERKAKTYAMFRVADCRRARKKTAGKKNAAN